MVVEHIQKNVWVVFLYVSENLVFPSRVCQRDTAGKECNGNGHSESEQVKSIGLLQTNMLVQREVESRHVSKTVWRTTILLHSVKTLDISHVIFF